MVWYDQQVKTQNQSDDAHVAIVGEFSDETMPPINIRVEYREKPEDEMKVHTVFTHAPSRIDREQPAADDILAYYRPKIWKLTQKLSKVDFSSIHTVKIS